MIKLTREERLAAGWRGSWVVKAANGNYSTGVREWGTGMWREDRKEAFHFADYADAASWIGWFAEEPIVKGPTDNVRIRRLWSRKVTRTKRPPMIGATVILSGKVVTVSKPNGNYVDVKIGEQVISVEASLVR